jgi:hypothetical protein
MAGIELNGFFMGEPKMKDIREHITQEQLKDEMYYDPETGIFRKMRVFKGEVVLVLLHLRITGFV